MRSRIAASFWLHGGVVLQLVRLHQDVPDVHCSTTFWPRAAHLVQPHDVKAGGGAQRLADLARLQLRDRVGEERRQLAALAPAERAAFERGLAVGVGNGELGEVFAALGALVDVLGLAWRLPRAAPGVAACGTAIRMCETLYSSAPRTRSSLLLEVLVDLARRDVDALDARRAGGAGRA